MKQIKDVLLNNIFVAKCISYGQALNKLMRLDEVWPEDQLLEADIKKALKKAAAAGLFGAGVLGSSGISPDLAMVSQPKTIEQPADPEDLSPYKFREPSDPEHAGELLRRKIGPERDPEHAGELLAKATKMKKPADTHHNFPQALWGQHKAPADEKMQAFVDTIGPLVDRANAKILADRRYLLQISNPKHTMDAEERAWYDSKLEAYGAKNLSDLLERMDIVPKRMAIAQGALESGWGSSQIARQTNAFFGMTAGKGYSAYKNPQESVSDYIHNLNTHFAYKDFRAARAKLRQERQGINSFQLIGHLGRYSELGSVYINHVKSMMSLPIMKDFDESRQSSRK
jgi:uncharacterized FlgJ-related protein